MGNNFAMNDQSLARSFSVRGDERDDFFHSSTYGGAQNGGRIGTAANGKSVEKRQDLDENRQYVRGYESATLSSRIAMARQRVASTGGGRLGGVNGEIGSSGGQVGNARREADGYRDYRDYAAAAKQKAEFARGGLGMKAMNGEIAKRGTGLEMRARSEGGAGFGSKLNSVNGHGAEGGGSSGGNVGGQKTRGGSDFGQRFAPNFTKSIERKYGGGGAG